MSLLDLPITSIMIANVVTVNPEQKLVDVKHIYEKSKFHHHIPVIENGRLVGIISLIDFLRAIKTTSLNDEDEAYQKLFVKDIMQSNPVTVPSSSSLKQAVEVLAKGEVHALIVSDAGILKGILSAVDVFQYFLKLEKAL